jgi:hypothetical protein
MGRVLVVLMVFACIASLEVIKAVMYGRGLSQLAWWCGAGQLMLWGVQVVSGIFYYYNHFIRVPTRKERWQQQYGGQ